MNQPLVFMIKFHRSDGTFKQRRRGAESCFSDCTHGPSVASQAVHVLVMSDGVCVVGELNWGGLGSFLASCFLVMDRR